MSGLQDLMKDYAPLDESKAVVTTGNNELRGTATGILYSIIVDQTGNRH